MNDNTVELGDVPEVVSGLGATLQALVDKIEAKYKEKEKQLSKKEKVRIKEIVKKSKGKPDVIKREIEESFGFTFVD